jgi:hypothetical protein
MKKILLSISLLFVMNSFQAQNIYNYGFNTTTLTGWTKVNMSTSPAAAGAWKVPAYAVVTVNTPTVPANPFGTTVIANGSTSPIPDGQAGGANSFAVVGKLSTSITTTAGTTLSNWLLTPSVTVENGNVVSFYTRNGTPSSLTNATKADRLELRMSTNGAFSTEPSLGNTDVGDYTNVLVQVNPTQTLSGYPTTWTRYSYTITGFSGPTECKFAFRYFVTNGGANATKSDIIGIDSFSVDTTDLAINQNFDQDFLVFPNPATNVVTVLNKKGDVIKNIEITDLNGRVISTLNENTISSEINISSLTSGIYFLKVQTENGLAVTKLMKE